MFNGGVETKPCTTPQCTGSDAQALHADAFYYSLAVCTVFLALGGSILAACCSATLSGDAPGGSAQHILTRFQVLFFPNKPVLCSGWIWPSGFIEESLALYLLHLLLHSAPLLVPSRPPSAALSPHF
jgi:hypothetical protein